MRIAALIPLLGCIWNLMLAFFVLSRAPRATQNRVYFFLGACISVWNLGQFFNFTTPPSQQDIALFWVKFVWFGVLFIPMLLFHLSMLLTQTRVGRFIPIVYVLLAMLAATLPSNFFITGVHHLGTAGWYANSDGVGLKLAQLPFALMFVAIVVLIRKRRTLPQMYRSRLTPLIIAQTMLAVLGTNDTLPLNGFVNYPGTQVPVYPYGSIAAVFYGVIVAYSLLQHHLLDVQIGLSRVAAQLVRILFLSVTTLALLLVATLIYPSAFNNGELWIALSVFIISIVIGTRVFPRLFGGAGVEKWERRILGDHFEYQDRIRVFTESVVWHSDLNSLFNGVHELFVGVFRFKHYWIILRDDSLRAFMITRVYPEEPLVAVPEIKVPSPIFTYFETEAQSWLNLGEHSLSRTAQRSELEAREQLARFPADFAMPLRWENELFGLVLIGSKLDDEPITATDLNLLADLTSRLSLVVNQIRLKDEVVRTQELELLGRMSRGMAHDLNNLLTPIWTLLQLASEGLTREALDEELLSVALRNIKSVRAYIKEALFFSENLRPDLQTERLDLLVTNVVELSRANRRKDVQITAVIPGEVFAEFDDVLIQRLLANLISNAIDASEVGKEVRVELERLVKTEVARDWFRVRVIDQGEGIPKEDLVRVTTPYFTTKNRGDEGRGFGLGLAICRKIATLHGGSLTIFSQLGRGTTVQIDLPNRHQKTLIPAVAPAA